ncbi:unnamed protein product [Amoebophrya sp. A120]|nr:unnamed protein product [Amoebophrya sp. A120]|eukprot:GSA120T00007171001.1
MSMFLRKRHDPSSGVDTPLVFEPAPPSGSTLVVVINQSGKVFEKRATLNTPIRQEGNFIRNLGLEATELLQIVKIAESSFAASESTFSSYGHNEHEQLLPHTVERSNRSKRCRAIPLNAESKSFIAPAAYKFILLLDEKSRRSVVTDFADISPRANNATTGSAGNQKASSSASENFDPATQGGGSSEVELQERSSAVQMNSATADDLRNLFKQEMDVNRSGVLCRAELRYFLYHLQLTDAEFDTLFTKLDIEKNGIISIDELLIKLQMELMLADCSDLNKEKKHAREVLEQWALVELNRRPEMPAFVTINPYANDPEGMPAVMKMTPANVFDYGGAPQAGPGGGFQAMMDQRFAAPQEEAVVVEQPGLPQTKIDTTKWMGVSIKKQQLTTTANSGGEQQTSSTTAAPADEQPCTGTDLCALIGYFFHIGGLIFLALISTVLDELIVRMHFLVLPMVLIGTLLGAGCYYGAISRMRFLEALQSEPVVGIPKVAARIKDCQEATVTFEWKIACYHTVTTTTGSGKNRRTTTKRVYTHRNSFFGELKVTDVSEKFEPKTTAVNPKTKQVEPIAFTRMQTDLKIDFTQSDYQATFQQWVQANWKDRSADYSTKETIGEIEKDFLAQWFEGVEKPWFLQEKYLSYAKCFGCMTCLKSIVINRIARQYVEFRKIAHPMVTKPPMIF